MSRSHVWRRCSLTLVFCLSVLVSSADAQSSNATLHGTVADSSGAVLPGVTVKLQAPATGLTRDVVTNTSGVYVFNFLPAGDYEITAELTGFKSVRQANIKLEIGQSLSVDLKLEVGQVAEVVEVQGIAPFLETREQHARQRIARHAHDGEPQHLARPLVLTRFDETLGQTDVPDRQV